MRRGGSLCHKPPIVKVIRQLIVLRFVLQVWSNFIPTASLSPPLSELPVPTDVPLQ